MDRITEPQEWIDGLVSEHSETNDIDVALQNMGLLLRALRAEAARLTERNAEHIAKIAHLSGCIALAPHSRDCAQIVNPNRGFCDCWKRAALDGGEGRK